MNNNTRDVHTANGVTTSFRFNFWIMLKDDITVYLGDVIQNGGFTVTGVLNPSGGEISFNTPPTVGTIVTLVLTPVPERLVTYQQNGDLPPEVLNNDLDRLYLLALAVSTIVLRSLSLGFSDIDGQGAYRANGNRITNLGAPVDDTDAVRKGEVVGLVKPYDDHARESAEAAYRSALDAAQSAVNAKLSEEHADTSAGKAKTEADRAEAAADTIDTSVLEGLISAIGGDLDATKASLGGAAFRNVGNSTDQIPDMSFFAALFTTQGYAKQPNGRIVQWGTQSSAEKTTTRATFPIPFPNGCLKVLPVGGTGAGGVHTSTAFNVADKNGFTFNAFSGASGSPPVLASANGVICYYLAEGW